MQQLSNRFKLPELQFSRYNSFFYARLQEKCKSRRYTHQSCVFGLNDLPYIVNSMKLSVHKMYLEFQPGAFACPQEVVYNRTYKLGDVAYGNINNYDVFKSMPQVRYINTNDKSQFRCIWRFRSGLWLIFYLHKTQSRIIHVISSYISLSPRVNEYAWSTTVYVKK